MGLFALICLSWGVRSGRTRGSRIVKQEGWCKIERHEAIMHVGIFPGELSPVLTRFIDIHIFTVRDSSNPSG